MSEEFQGGIYGENLWNMSRDFFASSSCSISSWCNNQEVFKTMNSSSRPSDDQSTASDRKKILQDLENSHVWNQYMIINDETAEENYSDISSREDISSSMNNYWQQTCLVDCPQIAHKTCQSPSNTYSNVLSSSNSYIYSTSSLLQSSLETDDTQQQQSLLENPEMKNYSSDFSFTGKTQSSVFVPLCSHRSETKINQLSLGTTDDHKERDLGSVAKKAVCHEPEISKRPRVETPSPLPTFKVRKEKLGDRVTALQQLVSPFGKTDTASVLHEAIEYIKFLHDQVSTLSAPYLKNGSPIRLQHHREATHHHDDQAGKKIQDLKSHGLCLVPISSTFPLAAETTADLWTKFQMNDGR